MTRPMSVLIVGGGIAGLTLAGLLGRQGYRPVVIERRPADDEAGYALALWPHGSRVFHALGVHDIFLEHSEPMRRYVARGIGGRTLMTSAMPADVEAFGELGILPRSDVVNILRGACDDVEIRYSTGIDTMTEQLDGIDVQLTDGSGDRFSLVVGADGIGSQVRQLLLGHVREYDTGWGCVVWWADPAQDERGQTTERWGPGTFVGTYPCRETVCIIAGGPLQAFAPEATEGPVLAARTECVRSHLRTSRLAVDGLLAELPQREQLYLWRMADIRAPRWVSDRVALVGDAAVAFLPTAGIGASMALESAAVLADELSRADARYVPNALLLYERRRRRRVEAAQRQSRLLARLMFLRSPVLSALRNRAISLMRMEQLVRPLISDLRRPI